MACSRDGIIKLKDYIESFGINVNIGKNKARGNRGFFIPKHGDIRIDIAKNLSDQRTISTLLHEFSHFIHYSYDKSLNNLDFIFADIDDELEEELISVSVADIPKEFASELIDKKEEVSNSIKLKSRLLKAKYCDFKLSMPFNKLERQLKYPLSYLLKYDRVKVFGAVYSVENLDSYSLTEDEKLYLEIKSKQRMLKRINAKINKINRYYNKSTELFARFIEQYFLNNKETQRLAPKCSNILKEKLKNNEIPMLNEVEKIFNLNNNLI